LNLAAAPVANAGRSEKAAAAEVLRPILMNSRRVII
jgi:hypothetical protein